MSARVVPLVKQEPLPGRSDDELMVLASAGVRAAFEELVRRHAGRVLAFCVKSTGDRAFGEEVAQEVWLAVHCHRGDYRPEGKFVVWLFTLARNRLKNAARDRARSPMRPLGDTETLCAKDDLSPAGIDRLIADQRRARVDGALWRLPDKPREALVLRFGQELPYEDVARVLGTSEATARARVFHGLRELRRRLRGDL